MDASSGIYNDNSTNQSGLLSQADDFGFSILGFLRMLYRQWPILSLIAFVILALGAIYLIITPAVYTATTSIMLDSRKLPQVQQQIIPDPGRIDANIESQIEFIRSEYIALSVIRELSLDEDLSWAIPATQALQPLRDLIQGLLLPEGNEQPYSEAARRQSIVATFRDRLSVRRVGLTYVIEISFLSNDPEKAAQIANAISNVYINDQVESQWQTVRRTGSWLEERMATLRAQAVAAEQAVEDFKLQNNLVGNGARLLNEQQLGEISSQLMSARATTAEARARYERLQKLISEDMPDAADSEVLKNEVITRLRQQYLDISRREHEWLSQYGEDHGSVANLRAERTGIQASIANEIRRIAETYKSDYEIAKARQASIEESLNSSIKESAETNVIRVKVRDLESSAQNYRVVYESFLKSYTEAAQQQSSPVPEARVITVASPPLLKTYPRTVITLGAALLIGLTAGSGAALLRERLDSVFRFPRQVESVTGLFPLGVLPRIPRYRLTVQEGNTRSLLPIRFNRNTNFERYVLEKPFSRYSETIFGIKIAADLALVTRGCKVIGITSAVPHEGRTTVAANVGQLIAQSGVRVLLIDADLRNCTLSKLLAPDAKIGLMEVLASHDSLSNALRKDGDTRLDFLPAILQGQVHTSAILSSEGMQSLIESARDHYDYLVFDLPPATSALDVKAVTNFVDVFVMVIQWGGTTRQAALEALQIIPDIRQKLLGAVLNNVVMRKLRRYESYKGRHYLKYYS